MASLRPTTSRNGTGRGGCALGADSSGGDGWLMSAFGTAINALTGVGSNLFVTGQFLDADGKPLADTIAQLDGSNWHPMGSDGAGNGPVNGTGLALALVDRQLYLAGSFTSAGGDNQAQARRVVRAEPDHRLPDAHGDPGPRPGPDAHGDPQPAGRHAAHHVASQDEDQPGKAQGDVQVRLRRAKLHVRLQARQQEDQAAAPRRRPTRGSRPASTRSASGRATPPATAMPPPVVKRFTIKRR